MSENTACHFVALNCFYISIKGFLEAGAQGGQSVLHSKELEVDSSLFG